MNRKAFRSSWIANVKDPTGHKINSHSSIEGCSYTAKDRNKIANATERFVLCTLRVVLILRKDLAQN